MPGHFTFYTHKTEGGLAYFDENEAGHVFKTLRYKVGDVIEFTDGKGSLYNGKIREEGKRGFTAEIIDERRTETRPGLNVYCGILKSGDRMELIVEKCTELGVASIHFLNTKNAERSAINEKRLLKTAIAAMKQSHRLWLPHITAISWNDAIHAVPGVAYLIHASGNPFPDQIGDHCSVFIGPEGDFTALEIQEAQNAGFISVTLGNAVLRTETAVIAAVARMVVP